MRLGQRARWVVAGLVIAGSLLFAATAASAPRPPYLVQAKPVYGDVFIAGHLIDPKKVWTYRGDHVLAIFDYDTVNGDPNVKRLPYTVCHTGRKQVCAKRVWRGRPDIWMVRVGSDGGYVGTAYKRYIEFAWVVGGKRRGSARVWVFE